VTHRLLEYRRDRSDLGRSPSDAPPYNDAVRRLRILHVTPYYEHAWAYGGIPRVVSALASGLVVRGHQVTVCTTDARVRDERLPRPDGTRRFVPWGETTPAGVDVRIFPNVSNRLAYDLQFFLPVGLSAYLRTHAADFDIAHVHACHNIPGAMASRYFRRAKVPYVLTPNGTAPRIERRLLAKYLFDLSIGRNVLGGAALLLAVSEAERVQLRSMDVPEGRIAVIPNPSDLDEFTVPIERGRFRARARLGDGELIMFLGKLTPRKRLDVLAHAFASLARPGARLIVVGNDMGYGAELDRLIDTLRIGDRTVRTGLLTGRDRLEALADADVVVYPSKDEIFGLVPIEAILCGTPVVVADDSGCGEVITRVGGGLVVPQGNAADLAKAITDVLEAPAHWRRSAEAAATRAREWYGAASVCDQLETVYRDVIAEARRT
jgi:glycosyltransferase involved in cell wall biosynthesis